MWVGMMSVARRLEKHSMPEPNTGCLLWTAVVNSGGYGHLKIAGRMVSAHRAAYEKAHGPIPTGLHVCHKCDVRSCINPEHLFLGTNADNIADMVAKARQRGAEGVRHWKAKLNPDTVRDIRSATGPQIEIATRFGVGQQTVSRIRSGRIWRHA